MIESLGRSMHVSQAYPAWRARFGTTNNPLLWQTTWEVFAGRYRHRLVSAHARTLIIVLVVPPLSRFPPSRATGMSAYTTRCSVGICVPARPFSQGNWESWLHKWKWIGSPWRRWTSTTTFSFSSWSTARLTDTPDVSLCGTHYEQTRLFVKKYGETSNVVCRRMTTFESRGYKSYYSMRFSCGANWIRILATGRECMRFWLRWYGFWMPTA